MDSGKVESAFATQDTQLTVRTLDGRKKYEIGCVVTQLRISDFGRLYAISLTCLVIYPSFHLCRLPGVATRDKTGDRSIGQRLTRNCKLATEALLLDVQASNVKPILFY